MQSLNLIPPDYVRAARTKRGLLVAGALVLAFVLALAGLARLVDKSIGRQTESYMVLERELNDLQRAKADLAVQTALLQDLAERLAVVETVSSNRRWSVYLARIAEAVPDEVLLTRASVAAVRPAADDSGPRATVPAGPTTAPATPGQPPGVGLDNALNPSKPDRLMLLLEGYALANTDITRFIAALRSAGIFERINFKSSQAAEINGAALSRFELECPLRYEPPKRPEPASVARAEGGQP